MAYDAEYQAQYYEKNSSKKKAVSKAWRLANPERAKAQNAKNYPSQLAWRKNKRIELKKTIFEAYGGKCSCCGESNYAFLAIDHVDGGGTQKRKSGEHSTSSDTFYRWIIKNGFPKEFQVLCHNCNWAKWLMGECPHKSDAFSLFPMSNMTPLEIANV